MSSTPAPPQLATLRRIIVAVIVVSFSVAAIMGIIALLARDLGDVGVKVLLTTATVGLYLESVGNPRKFSRIPRRVWDVKPGKRVRASI